MKHYYSTNFKDLINGLNLKEGDDIEVLGVPKIMLFKQTIKEGIIGLIENDNNFIVIKINFNEQNNDRIRLLTKACSMGDDVVLKGCFIKYNNFSGIKVSEVTYLDETF